jgi:hypothetical protein
VVRDYRPGGSGAISAAFMAETLASPEIQFQSGVLRRMKWMVKARTPRNPNRAISVLLGSKMVQTRYMTLAS